MVDAQFLDLVAPNSVPHGVETSTADDSLDSFARLDAHLFLLKNLPLWFLTE